MIVAQARLSVYGLEVALKGWAEVVERVRLDYAWFATEESATPEVTVEIDRRPAGFDAFVDAVPWFVTPRNAVYRQGGRIVLDHLGRAVSVLEADGNRLWIQGEDEHVVHDAVYYFVLGRVGKHLDARGLTRLHALGVAGAGGGVAVLLPAGGGKTTLALEAIKAGGVRLLSEDSPLLDGDGRLHPFPLRIGVDAGDTGRLPPGANRRIERVWLHPKVAVEVATFADRVATEPQPLRHLVVGRRSLAREPSLDPLPRRAGVGPLLHAGVLGVGLYQGLGFAHQRGAGELAAKARTASGRARACRKALTGARVWRLNLCRDSQRNWGLLATLLE